MLARQLLREHERERAAWARERRQLIETICHLAGKPLPDETPDAPIGDELEDETLVLGLVPDSAQMPDY